MAQKRAAGKPEERRRGGARQNPEGQLKKRVETRNTPGSRAQWKPGNMIYPVPAVLVTVADCEGNSNIITIAWTGTICTNPPMAYISAINGAFTVCAGTGVSPVSFHLSTFLPERTPQ